MKFEQIIKDFNNWYCAACTDDDGAVGVVSQFIKRGCNIKAWEKALAVRVVNYANNKGYIFDIYDGFVKRA